MILQVLELRSVSSYLKSGRAKTPVLLAEETSTPCVDKSNQSIGYDQNNQLAAILQNL